MHLQHFANNFYTNTIARGLQIANDCLLRDDVGKGECAQGKSACSD
jgi:hypothetical protein